MTSRAHRRHKLQRWQASAKRHLCTLAALTAIALLLWATHHLLSTR